MYFRHSRSSTMPVGTLLVLSLLLGLVTIAGVRAQVDDPGVLETVDAACETTNPFLATTCFIQGVVPEWPAIVAFQNSPDMLSGHHVLATVGQVGATWGIAYRPADSTLFASAFHKRATAFGPGGPGAIYRLDLSTGSVEIWADVPDAGADLHDPAGGFMPDNAGIAPTGKTSLGDLDLSEDGSELFVMNVASRRIHRYRVGDAAPLGDFAHGAAAEPWAESESRPFGLKFWQGRLYHGVVRDASVSGDSADLHAFVYSSESDGTDMREVLSFPLAYVREGPLRRVSGTWLAWTDEALTLSEPNRTWPQPWLTDIEFTPQGDMILGLRDRLGDVTLFQIDGALPPGERNGIPGGDQLIARKVDAFDSWAFDPAEAEFFAEDASGAVGARDGGHPETGFGGLAMLARDPRELVVTALSPLRSSSGGAMWFDVTTGGNTRREELYSLEGGPTFGKANGLGDVEDLCGPAIYTAYLPIADSECIPEKRYVDVVLVLDRSTSMRRPVTDGGIPKNEAAIEAAYAFVENLQLEADPDDEDGRHDQVSIVGFNSTSWTEIPLTNDRDAVAEALESIRGKTVRGTRLDLAIQHGQVPLDGPERILENLPIVLVLTDGTPSSVPHDAAAGERQEDTVLRETDAVKARGTRVITIGLGLPGDINARLLVAMATEPGDYYYVPAAEELPRIYRQIAGRFTYCGREGREAVPTPIPTPCIPGRGHSDAVLVLDLSTSMQRNTRDGRAKYEAAIEAARAFIDLLDLESDGSGLQDQVAIVGFNDTAWTELRLTSDRDEIDAALRRLPSRLAEGTRLDLALSEGLSAWEGSLRVPGNRPVMILLTDGLPNRVPTPIPSGRQEDTVIAEAERVKAAGMRVFSIGLGLPDDVLRELLESVASSPRDHFFAPDGEDLAEIYRQIAGRVSECP